MKTVEQALVERERELHREGGKCLFAYLREWAFT